MIEWTHAARFAMATGILVALAWVALVAIAYVAQRWLVYPRWAAPDLSRKAGALHRVEIPTADGETLQGYWRAPTGPAGVVVTFHANASAPEPHARRFGKGPWERNGWGYLAVAYRGYPGSTGRPSEAGLLSDGMAATAFARGKAPDAPILFHGHSIGTAVAVAMAAIHPAKGLYLEAPLPSMTAVARRRFPFLPMRLLRDTYRSDERIGRVRAPVFAVQGLVDRVIPVGLGEALMGNVRAAQRTFRLVQAGHASVFAFEDAAAEEFFRDRLVEIPLPL